MNKLRSFYLNTHLLVLCLTTGLPSISHGDTGSTSENKASTYFAKINNETIPQSHFDFVFNSRFSFQQSNEVDRVDKEDLSEIVTKDLLLAKLLAQEAISKGMAKDPNTVAELQLAHNTLLAQLLVQRKISEVSYEESALKSAYAAVPNPVHYRIEVYQVERAKEAEKIVSMIDSDTNKKAIDSALKAYPSDESTWLRIEDMDPIMLEAILPLEIHDYATQAVPSSYGGWKIIQLLAKEEFEKAPFEDMVEILKSEILNQELQDMIDKIVASAQIEFPHEKVLADGWHR